LGLLYLLGGDLALGRDFYLRAESMAIDQSRGDLVKAVRQKMHLELAKAFLANIYLQMHKKKSLADYQ